MLYTDPKMGQSFEAFAIEELLKGLEATSVTNWDSYYYRTHSDAEIDLILDGHFGLFPIEIKFGSLVNMKQLISLTQFVKQHKLLFGMLINQSSETQWLTPEIVQVPIGWL